MWLPLLLVIAGFVLLIFGADWLVSGSSSLARKYGVPDIVIGLTIVAFGTSAPELVVNIFSSSHGYSELVLGNIIGSNNFNLFIILGLAGLLYPIRVSSSTAWREIPVSIGITALLLGLVQSFSPGRAPVLSRFDGIILLLLFLLFLYYIYRQLQAEKKDVPTEEQRSGRYIWTLIVLGLAGLIGGGQLVVQNSIKIAEGLGVSEKIIGLTIVAAGTSLPELVTSVTAALRRNSDIAIGNVIGSNIFNILLILSVSSLIRPVAYSPAFNRDLLILLGGSAALLLFMVTGEKKKLDRWEAALLFSFYLGYTVFLVSREL